jgi:hypothetical protein
MKVELKLNNHSKIVVAVIPETINLQILKYLCIKYEFFTV